MANIKSNIKSFRKNTKRKARNKAEISAYRSKVKSARKTKGSIELSSAFKKLDSVASKKKIHKNKANRLKSRLAKAANKK